MDETLQLWVSREKIANLYNEIRSSADTAAAWQRWCKTRTAMFRKD